MLVTKANLARYFILGFINMLRFSVDDPVMEIGRAMTDERVMAITIDVATEFPYFAEYRSVEDLLVNGYALLLDKMKLGDPEKIISREAYDYIRDLAKGITSMMDSTKPIVFPRPTEEIY